MGILRTRCNNDAFRNDGEARSKNVQVPAGRRLYSDQMKETSGPHGSGEVLAFRRLPSLGAAELLHGRYGRFAFARHAHDRVSFSLIERGALRVAQPGGIETVPAGSLILFDHDRVHWGGSEERHGWWVRTLYVDPAYLASLAAEQGHRGFGTVGFAAQVSRAPDLLARFRAVHDSTAAGGAPLELESLLQDALSEVLLRHGEARLDPPEPGQEPRAVTRAREMIEDRVADALTLADLSEAAGLSPYRLNRVFAASLGMPPHAYQTHLRSRLALRLLRDGRAVSEVALTCGFADQSHLTRVLKRQYGFTPGAFRAA